MSGLSALWYLDSRRFIRGVIGIFRRPARLLMWLIVALYFSTQLLLRQHMQSPPLFPPIDARWAGSIAIVGFAAVALALWQAAAVGRVHAATEPIDALFLARSALSPRLVAAWLYGRYFLITYGRSLFALLYLAVVSRSLRSGPVLSISGLFLAVEMLRITAAYAGHNRPWLPRIFLALAALCGIALVTNLFLVDLHTDEVFDAVLAGNPVTLASIYGIAVAALLAGWFSATDIYPEIYASSTLRAALLRRRTRGLPGVQLPASTRPTHSGTTMLRGPWVEIWKQMTFLRRRNGRTILAVGVGIGLAIGVAAAIADRYDSSLSVSILLSFAVFSALGLTVMSVSLAHDLAKPLWWLGQGSVVEKLAAWAIGSSLPVSAIGAIAALVYALLSGPALLPGMLFASIALPAPMRGVGALTYSVLPNKLDQRGPGVMLRLFIIYAALAIAVAAGAGIGFLLGSAEAGLYGGMLAFVLEGAGALALAAALISGRGAEFAIAEA